MKNIANEDLQVEFSNLSGPPDVVYSGDQGIDPVKIKPTKCTKVKACGKAVCHQKIDLVFSAAQPCPHSSATHTFVSGVGLIITTATKVKAEGIAPLRQEDTGSCTGSWQMTASPFTVITCSCDLKISDAGQDKAKGA